MDTNLLGHAVTAVPGILCHWNSLPLPLKFPGGSGHLKGLVEKKMAWDFRYNSHRVLVIRCEESNRHASGAAMMLFVRKDQTIISELAVCYTEMTPCTLYVYIILYSHSFF